MIRRFGVLLKVFCVFLCFSYGANALEINSLEISVDSDGSAQVNAYYSLNEQEKTQYDLITHFINPISTGNEQMGNLLHKKVRFQSITPEYTGLHIERYASLKGQVLTTPKIMFENTISLGGKNMVWIFQRFNISPIPHNTTIIFPDGYSESFFDSSIIPSIAHQPEDLNIMNN